MASDDSPKVRSLGARVHLFVRLAERDRFVAVFKDVLGCNAVEKDFGLPHPILFVGFEDGSGFSVEFSDNAPDEQVPSRAWIEFRADRVHELQQKLRDAGVHEFQHPGSPHTYFTAPGGQVFRLLDVGYKGP